MEPSFHSVPTTLPLEVAAMGPIIRDIDEIYAKDKRIKREDVRILKEWLQKQEHLPQMTGIL